MKEAKLYRFIRPILNVFSKICFRPKFIGLENLPKNGSFILVGNHTNILDPVVLTCITKRTIHFLAKDDLTKGLKKVIFNNMGIIPVNRHIHDSNTLKNGVKALNDGEIICIFPEGTINRTKDVILPFKSGAVRMASQTNKLIIPFTIKGKYKLFRKNITFEFYKPYKVSGDVKKDNEDLMKIISINLIKEK